MAGAGTLISTPVPQTTPQPSAPQTTPASPARPRALLGAAALIVVAGTAIRFAALSGSIWFDEAVSVRDVSGSFGQMLHRVVNHEASPPFYFICLWIWRHLAGGTAVELRTLSALAGSLTIALAGYVAWRRIGPRAGLVLAACVAVSPSLVYFSTEMRMYGLLVLITGIGFEAFLRACHAPHRNNLGVWAAMAILALWTQYFSALLIVPEAAVLMALAWKTRPESLGSLIAIGAVVLAGAPLIYLMPYQADHAFAYGGVLLSSSWQHLALFIHSYPTLPSVAHEVAYGPEGPARGLVTGVACLVAIFSVGYLHRRGRITRQQLIWACCVLAPTFLAVFVLVCLHLAVSGRYLLPLWLPMGMGAGYVAATGRLGLWLAGLLICLWAVVLLVNVTVPRYASQDDTLGAARSLGVATGDRLIAISQPWDVAPFEAYRPQATVETNPLPRVREIDVVAMPASGEPPPGDHVRPVSAGLGAMPRGLRLAQVIRGSTFLVERFIAAAPVSISINGRGSTFARNYWRFLHEPVGARMGSL